MKNFRRVNKNSQNNHRPLEIRCHSGAVYDHLVAFWAGDHRAEIPRLFSHGTFFGVTIVWFAHCVIWINGEASRPYNSSVAIPQLGKKPIVHTLENVHCAAFKCSVGSVIRTRWDDARYLVTETAVEIISKIEYERRLALLKQPKSARMN